MVRTVNLTDDAYARLASLKREGESFSDVVYRLTGKHAIRGLYGILSPRKAESLRRAVHASKKDMDREYARRRVRL